MKTIKYFIIITVSAFFFTNCTIELGKWKDVDLSEVPDKLVFSGRGKCFTDNSLPHSYYVGYEYKTNQNWCFAGWDYNRYESSVFVEMNKTGQARTATVRVILDGETIRTINVEQAALDYIIIGDLCIQKTDIIPNVLTRSTAQSLANSSRVEDFTDWRLPSLSELQVMYERRNEIGGFKTTLQNGNKYPFYWSYEYYGDNVKNFYNGAEGRVSDSDVGEGSDKYNIYARLVRTVRWDD